MNNQNETPLWLAREASLIGQTAVRRLQNASVAVFGLGGVGSYTAEALARAGVGRLLLIDGDCVDITNLNRQLVALTSTVGQAKAEVAATRIRDIAPDCDVQAHVLFYSEQEGAGLIDGCDFVADAIDSVSSKIALALECRDKRVPLISAMGCGNKLDPTAFLVDDIANTSVCPLCRVMRRELRARGIEHLPVVYSKEPPTVLAAKGERVPPASISFVPSVAGLILAGHIVKELIKEA